MRLIPVAKRMVWMESVLVDVGEAMVSLTRHVMRVARSDIPMTEQDIPIAALLMRVTVTMEDMTA